MDWAKTTARGYKKHLNFGIWCDLYYRFYGNQWLGNKSFVLYDKSKSPGVEIAIFMWRSHDDVVKWKHFPRYWPFVGGIHRSLVNSPHKGQWRGALMFSLICVWINGWVNNREAGDLRRYHAHYDVPVMQQDYNRRSPNLRSCIV